jgi:hypothetical protein
MSRVCNRTYSQADQSGHIHPAEDNGIAQQIKDLVSLTVVPGGHFRPGSALHAQCARPCPSSVPPRIARPSA